MKLLNVVFNALLALRYFFFTKKKYSKIKFLFFFKWTDLWKEMSKQTSIDHVAEHLGNIHRLWFRKWTGGFWVLLLRKIMLLLLLMLHSCLGTCEDILCRQMTVKLLHKKRKKRTFLKVPKGAQVRIRSWLSLVKAARISATWQK